MDKLQEAQLNQQAITNEHLDALHTLSGELNDKIDKLNKGLTDHKIEVNVPEFKDFPEIKLPDIKIPEIKIPKIEVPNLSLQRLQQMFLPQMSGLTQQQVSRLQERQVSNRKIY